MVEQNRKRARLPWLLVGVPLSARNFARANKKFRVTGDMFAGPRAAWGPGHNYRFHYGTAAAAMNAALRMYLANRFYPVGLFGRDPESGRMTLMIDGPDVHYLIEAIPLGARFSERTAVVRLRPEYRLGWSVVGSNAIDVIAGPRVTLTQRGMAHVAAAAYFEGFRVARTLARGFRRLAEQHTGESLQWISDISKWKPTYVDLREQLAFSFPHRLACEIALEWTSDELRDTRPAGVR